MPKIIHFHWVDYTVFAAFLIGSALIGVLVGWIDRKKNSAKDFLTGGDQVHWVLVAFSMQASFLSAIFILSGPGEIYAHGTVYGYIIVGSVFAIPLVIHYYMPVFYKLNIISAYEYLEKRFNRGTRLLGSAIFCVQILLYLAVVLYAPSLALHQVTGFPLGWAISFCGLVCTMYTCVGGMKATIWNDSIQMVIIYTGLLVVTIRGVYYIGGVAEVLRISNEGGRIIANEFRIDPTIRTTFWTQICGGFTFFTSSYATSQAIIQKFIGCRSLATARKAMYFTIVSSAAVAVIVYALGLVTYAYYHTCDPVTSNRVGKLDQVVALLVMELMGDMHGLPGLFMSTVFSGSLSSMSGCLSALSAVILTDFILPVYNKRFGAMEEKLRVTLSRSLVLFFGLLTTFLSFQAHYMGESIIQLSFSVINVTGGPLLGIVTLGIFTSFANAKGAIAGFLTGISICKWIAVGAIVKDVHFPTLPFRTDGCVEDDPMTNLTSSIFRSVTDPMNVTNPLGNDIAQPMWLFRVSFFYYGVIGFVITFFVGSVVSLATGRPKIIDQRLLHQWSKKQSANQDLEKEKKVFLERESEWENIGQTSIIVSTTNGDVPVDTNGDVPIDPNGDVPIDPSGYVPVDPNGDVPIDPSGYVPIDPNGDYVTIDPDSLHKTDQDNV